MQCFDMSKRLLAECSAPDVYQNKGRAALSLPPLVPSEMISLVQALVSVFLKHSVGDNKLCEPASKQDSTISLNCIAQLAFTDTINCSMSVQSWGEGLGMWVTSNYTLLYRTGIYMYE